MDARPQSFVKRVAAAVLLATTEQRTEYHAIARGYAADRRGKGDSS